MLKINDYKWFYGNYTIQKKLIAYLQDREFAMLPAKSRNNAVGMRNLRSHNMQGLQFWLDRLQAFENKREYNFYYSMAKFADGVPMRDPKTMKLEDEGWNDKAHDKIIAYDMLVDIDAGDHGNMDYAAQSAIRIKQRFDRLNVPYILRFSGMGFHFVIPSVYFIAEYGFITDFLRPKNIINTYKVMMDIAEYLYDADSELVDKNIFDSRRLCKIPYSLSIYDGKAYVCSPIADLEGFQLEHYLYEGVPKDYPADILRNEYGNIRGLLEEVKWQSERLPKRKSKD